MKALNGEREYNLEKSNGTLRYKKNLGLKYVTSTIDEPFDKETFTGIVIKAKEEYIIPAEGRSENGTIAEETILELGMSSTSIYV